MLAPIPVNGLVLAQLYIGDQSELEQGVSPQQNEAQQIDAVGAAAYIVKPEHSRTISELWRYFNG